MADYPDCSLLGLIAGIRHVQNHAILLHVPFLQIPLGFIPKLVDSIFSAKKEQTNDGNWLVQRARPKLPQQPIVKGLKPERNFPVT